LIPETLKDMLSDEDFIAAQKALEVKGQQQLTKEERKQRQRTLDTLGVPPFHEKITEEKLLMRKPTEIFQINVGLYCNQACSHCHVESSPKRKEVMSLDVADQCLDVLSNSPSISVVDLTGNNIFVTTRLRVNLRLWVDN
jgi:sulfatase maturation enzyme AslB (radical SAM superfamily)